MCLLGTSLIKANKELTYDAIVARSKNSLHIIFCILGNFGGGAKGHLKPRKIVLLAARRGREGLLLLFDSLFYTLFVGSFMVDLKI